MRLLILVLFAAAQPWRASHGERGRAPPPSPAPTVARPDTILRRDLLAPRPVGPAPAWGGVRVAPTLHLGLAPLAVEPPGLLAMIPDPRERLPWIGPRVTVPRLRDPRVWAGGFRGAAVRDFLRARAAAGARPPSAVSFLPPLPEAEAARNALPALAGGEELTDFVSRYAEIGVSIRGRMELGGDWTRFRPCADQFQQSCNPTLLPQLRPDVSLAVGIQGTVADRVHVNVDYDKLREFGAANTISIVYQGLEDDILRRFEVGDVTFGLPRSRFLTQGIPSGNFGFQAEGQLGPVEFRGVWAEQKGDLSLREFHLTGVGSQRRFVQEDTLVLDDADYARGQFFFLFDPRVLADHPHIDILDLGAGSAPASVVPGAEPIQVYRFENDPVARQQVEGFIQADAVAEADGQRVEESGWFRYLIPGQDYFVHPSGLWIALRTPLSRDEMLAVTYVTALGDTVGTYNPERVYTAGGRPRLRLLKASGANHQPGRPTWDLEMHQVYRVSSSPDVERASVDVTVSLGELSGGRIFKRAPDGRDVTFLQLFGLDAESPIDRVDPAFVYAPAEDLFQEPGGVQGTFLVFPTLHPFADPPPNPALDLSAAEAAELLGADANRRIYESEDPFERDNGGRFRLTIPFRVRSEGVISSFSLGALGIRDGSERILLGDRVLAPGVDYTIDYDVGQVTLLDAEALFATQPDAPVRATWEQKQIFRQAPTSVFGFNAHVGQAETGRLDVLALYRTEKTLVKRPTLGLEPGAALVGGLSGRLERGVGLLDRLLGAVPGLRVGEASSFGLEGELAISVPNPNTRNEVFLDDFDATDERPLSLLSYEWTRGSAPERLDGAEAVLPGTLDESTLASLVWQHTWILESPEGDSVGIHEGFLPREEIDGQIRVAGNRVRETGLRLTFGRATFDRRRWASLTTTLSPTGTDLTRSEFIEFYVSGGEGLDLVVDLGMVSEDAAFVDDQGRTSGVKANGVPWGRGTLDQEADPARGQVWGNAADALGVWGESCEAQPGRIYRLGDPRADCTRGNGRNDGEDLDGDGNLDANERVLRYVVPLGGSSPFLARTRSETGTAFRLYRIPIRSVFATQVNGPVTDADLRAVRHLRLTVAGGRTGALTIARMRISGSRWIKRGPEGVLSGIGGDTLAVGGRVEVGPASRVTEGDGYVSPPGVLEQLADPTFAVGGQGVEFNEKSLALRVEQIGPGDRAEVYSRFPQRPRDFLTYREIRFWVVARDGDWGPEEPASFYFKIGTDPENFYLYRTPLRRPADPSMLTPGEWLPEVTIDVGVFLDLRRRAEEILSLSPRVPGEAPLELWTADSTYAVVLRDRGRAPNLAKVRELALGVWNRGETPFTGELWIDELRLARGIRDAGVAAVVNASLDAGDVVQTRLTMSSRGAFFRQLDERATYQEDRNLSLRTSARLERLAPAEWGVEMPLTFDLDRSTLHPTFLAESDIRADRLADLRPTGSSRTRVALGFRKTTPAANPLLGLVLDGLESSVAYYRTRSSSVTSRVEAEGVDVRVGYDRRLEPREFDPVPGFLEPLVRWLFPAPLERAILDTRVRWSPERLAMGTSYGRRNNRIFRFDRILATAADSVVTPTEAPREALETAAEVTLRPLESLTADMTFLSTRDLLAPEEAVANPDVQRLLARERASVAGVDLGWETRRSLRTRIDYRPRVVPWLRHELTWSTRYASDRNPGFVGARLLPSDTVFVLQRNASGERELRTFLSLDPAGIGRALGWGSGAGQEGGEHPGGLAGAVSHLRPLSYTYRDGIFSRFNRDAVGPGAGYQFGWAGLDGYRVLDGDTAATLTDRTTHQVTWGLAAERLGLDASYARTDVATLDTRADRTLRSETWPDVTARVDAVRPPPGVRSVLQRLSFSVGITRSRRAVTYGQTAQQRRTRDLAIPLDVTASWVGGMSTSYRASLENGRGEDPTGDTEREGTSHRISLTSAFRAPFGWARGLNAPVRLSLLGGYRADRECRVPVGRAECVAFVDQLDRSLSLTLDSQVSGFDVGLQMTYSDRQSFVGQRRGSTQFQFQIFGQFVFEGGPLASPLR